MKPMCCLFLAFWGITLALPALAQDQAACKRALAHWQMPNAITINDGQPGTEQPIFLLSRGGMEIYGIVKGAPPSASYWLIVIYQDEQVRERAVQQLPATISNPSYMKYAVIHVGITGNQKNERTDCTGIQCEEEPFSIHYMQSVEYYMPRQCVAIPPHPDYWKLQGWENTGGYDGGPTSQALLGETDRSAESLLIAHGAKTTMYGTTYDYEYDPSALLPPLDDEAFLILLQRSYKTIQTKFQETMKQAKDGNAEAQDALGIWYRDGKDGAPQDYAQSAIWFRKAAEQGDMGAQFGLGILYSRGQGVPQDNLQAYFWFRVAVDEAEYERKGQQTSVSIMGTPAEAFVTSMEQAAQRLTPQDLSQENAEAARWLAQHK